VYALTTTTTSTINKERLYFTGKLNLVFFHLNPGILAKSFNLIYYTGCILKLRANVAIFLLFLSGNEGVVKGQKSNRKGVIRLNTIKDIIEQVQ